MWYPVRGYIYYLYREPLRALIVVFFLALVSVVERVGAVVKVAVDGGERQAFGQLRCGRRQIGVGGGAALAVVIILAVLVVRRTAAVIVAFVVRVAVTVADVLWNSLNTPPGRSINQSIPLKPGSSEHPHSTGPLRAGVPHPVNRLQPHAQVALTRCRPA